MTNLVDVVFVTDASFLPTFVSPAAEEVLGVSRERARDALLEAVHGEDLPRLEEMFKAISVDARPVPVDLRLRHAPTGQYRWVEAIGRGFADKDGRFAGAVVALREVDTRKRAEHARGQLQASRDALNEVARGLDRHMLDGSQRGPLLRQVCEDIAATMSYPLVWIALKKPDGSALILAGGGSAAPALEGCSVRWDDSPAGAGPSGTAMRTGATHTSALAGLAGSDTIDRALAAGINHATAIPLMTPDAIMGVLCVGVSDTRAPVGQLLVALESFAARLSLALQIADHQALLALQGAAMAASTNGLFITDAAGRIEWVNAAFERMSGFTRAEAIGKTPAFLRSELQSREVFAGMWSTVRAGDVWRGEIINNRKGGESYIVAQTVTPLLDDGGAVTHLVAAHEDVTARRQAETMLEHLARHDPLTDLPARALFIEGLQLAITRGAQTHETVAVLFLDLDSFKLVNDTLGHAVGDSLLREIAVRLTACVRTQDLVARLGGDEFAVVLPACDTATAIRVAERILDKVGEPMKVAGHEISATASIGIAVSAPDTLHADSLLKQADVAMYRAKEIGRNVYVLFTPGTDHLAGSGLSIQAGLRRALAQDELTLHYQPQMDATSGTLVGVEALLRWTSPDLGVVSPASFIPVAEQTGLIADIDRWVLRAACLQAGVWQEAGIRIPRVAVNVSGVSFRRGQLLTWIQEALAEARLAPQCLEIELTEGIVMHDATKVIDALAELRRLGVRIALDDFGTGYSSLSYLKRFRLDALKIDRTFVSGLPYDQESAAIARLIIAMAQALHMETIAEGVETAGQARFLQSLGCSTLQGFLFSRGLAPADLARFVQGTRRADGEPLADSPLSPGPSYLNQ